MSAELPSGHDWRGLWWNPNLAQLEGNSCGTCNGTTGPGIRVQDLNGSGIALPTGTTVLPANQPDFQSQGDYNYDDNEIIYYHNGQIYRVDRTTNVSLPTLTITGLPVFVSNLNNYVVGYSGVPGAEIMVYDYLIKRVYFINKVTGAYAGTSQLPASAPGTFSNWQVGFANGQVFVHNGSSTWYGYQVVQQGAGGGAVTCSFTVTVNDTEAPELTCVENFTAELNQDGEYILYYGIIVTQIIEDQSDNCGLVTGQGGIGASRFFFDCSDVGQMTTVTILNNDINGNQTPCNVNFIVTDPGGFCNEPPVAVCKNLELNADSNCEADVAASAFDGGSSDPDGDPLTFSVSPEGPYPLGMTSVTLTAEDGNGGVSTCAATVTVTDVTPPTIGVNNSAFVNPGSVAIPGNFNSELGCAGDWEPWCPNIELGYDADDQVWQGTFNIPGGYWEYKAALDDSWDENYGLGGQYFGPNIPLNLGSATSVKFYYDPQTNWITDNVNSRIITAAGSFQSEIGCPGDWDPSCLRSWLQDPDGDDIYESWVTGIPAGNYEYKIAINESWDENYGDGGVQGGANIPFTVPDDNTIVIFRFWSAFNQTQIILIQNEACTEQIEITSYAGFCTGSTPDFLALTNAYDNCGVTSLTQSPAAGTPVGVGTTTVTIKAQDAAGLMTTCNTSVTVYDYTPPTVLCQSATVQLNDDGVATVTVGEVAAEISDACGIAQSGIWNPEFSCENIGTNTVTLYAFDNNGNYNECQATVTVEDNISPEIDCPGPITTGTDPGQCGANVAFTVTATDNCDETTIVCTIGGAPADKGSNTLGPPPVVVQSGDFFPVGTTTVTCTVTDGSDNTDVCTFDIIVNDTEAPKLATPCPDNITRCGAQTVDWIPPTAMDNCAVVQTDNNYNPGDFFAVGSYTVTYTFYDEAGLSVSCSFVITINPLPEVAIDNSDLPEWCQGVQVLTAVVANEADLAPPLTYEWSTGEEGTDQITVYANGLYEVVVTDANLCSTTTEILVDEDLTELLSAHTIIVDDEMEMINSTVVTGGVGVEDADEIDIEDFSAIQTFLVAAEANIDATSTVADWIEDDSDLDLPDFMNNSFYNTNHVSVPDGGTMTLSGTNYGSVIVGEGATLYIDNANMYVYRLTLEEGATLMFNQPTNMMIRRELRIDEFCNVNVGGPTTVLYVRDDVSIKEGSTVAANIYTREGIEVNDSGDSEMTYMIGLFIAEELRSGDFVEWGWNTICSAFEEEIPQFNAAITQPGNIEEGHETKAADLKVFPNPTSGVMNVVVEDFLGQQVEYVVYDIQGKEVMRQVINQLELPVIIIDMSPAQFTNGMYQVSLKGSEEVRTVRFVLNK